MSFSGSLWAILDSNAKLLDQIDAEGNAPLAKFLAEQRESLHKEAKACREQQRDETFE
jgi:hypothetical protein